MVGFRVFDVGLLLLWLLWFFRLRDDEDDQGDEGGGGGPDLGGDDRGPKGGGGRGRRIPAAKRRLRGPVQPRGLERRRGAEPIRRPLPARVRQPAAPVPARRA